MEFVGKPGLSYDGVPAGLSLGPFFFLPRARRYTLARNSLPFHGSIGTGFPPPVIVSRRKRKAGVENNGEDTARRRVRSCAKREKP